MIVWRCVMSEETSQRSNADQKDDPNLLSCTHLQLPYHGQRKQQDDEVLNNAQTGASEANDGGDRQTFGIGDGLVPD